MRNSGTTSLIKIIGAVLITTLVLPVASWASLDAPAASPNSVTLSWSAPGDDASTGTASQYDIRYSLSTITDGNWDAATQIAGEPAPSAAGSAEQFDVSGLAPNTTYYFAIKTADEVPNWSTLSNIAIKTTDPEETPPGVVANLGVGSASATSLTLGWTAPGDDGASGTASAYDIRYSTSVIDAGNWSSATQLSGEPSPQVAGSSETMLVSGLTTSTTYYFALMTADEVPNWSGMSNVASGSTGSETNAPATIANLGSGSPTETSIALSWTAPGDDGMSGTASQYDIRYSTALINEANFAAAIAVASPPAPSSAGSLQSFTVTGLNSGTTYFFAVKTADEIPNWSAISNITSLSTSNDATSPVTIASLDAVLPTLNSLTLVWTAPGDDGSVGTASSYDVRYSTDSITVGNWNSATQMSNEPAPNPAGTPESLSVAGLAENTTYYFAIKAADERDNWSGLSNIATNKTALDSTPPASINDLAAAPGSDNGEIDLSWTAPGDDGSLGTAMAYDIRYSSNPISAANWFAAIPWGPPPDPMVAGTSQSVTITSLIPGDTYYVGIRTFDDAVNPAPISNIVSCEAKFEFILANGNIGQPSSPAPLAILPTAQPVLVVENADVSPDNVYRFELATDSNFFGLVAGGVVNQDYGTTTSWKVDQPLNPDQEYFWRVGSNDDGYSNISSFFVEPFAHAYPNPVRFSQADEATFTDLPAGGDLTLLSLSGSVVREWSNLSGHDVVWDGTNESGNQVASGTYMWYSPASGAKGKLVVIN